MGDRSECLRSRREAVRTLAGVAGLTTIGASNVAAIQTLADRQPDHVTLSYDSNRLERHQPRLITSALEIAPVRMYAWTAESDQYDHDAVHCYWTWYRRQSGAFALDSHWQDREPIYVYVSDGSVDHVRYTAYHWLAASGSTRSDTGRPLFEVAKKYHHYRTTDDPGELVELADLRSVFDAWLRNGWDDDLAPGAAADPAIMLSRASWWRRGAFGVSLNEQLASSFATAGIFGGGNTDL